MKRLVIQYFVAIVLGISLAVSLLWLLSRLPGQLSTVHAADLHVCPSGCLYSSVQAAVDAAGAGDLIKVAEGTYTGVSARAGVTQVVYINKTVTVQGGYTTTNWTTPDPIAQPTTLDAQGQGRVLYITGNISPTIEGLRITNGNAAGPGGVEYGSGAGGGIYIISATTTLRNNLVFSNIANIRGGGLYLDSGAATLSGNTISGNTGRSGGGIYNDGGLITLGSSTVSGNTSSDGSGGGINNYFGVVAVNNTLIQGNTANGTSGRGGGVRTIFGSMTLDSSTISSNAAAETGGGIYSEGTLVLNNSTISANAAGQTAGGIFHTNGHALSVNSSTIAYNVAGDTGGLYFGYGSVTLRNSIVASNFAKNSVLDCYAYYPSYPITSAGYNLIGDVSACPFTPSPGDLTNVDPHLGRLVGSPPYHHLLPDSPAIDAGNPGGCMGSDGLLSNDQRGAARVGRCDIGAYEYTLPGPAARLTTVSGGSQRTSPLSAFELPFEVSVLDSIGSPVSNTIVTFSAPMSEAGGTFADSGVYTSTAATDVDSFASSALLIANDVTGTYTVTAAVSGVITPANLALTNQIGWYVSPSGDDANTCQTPALPCASVTGVLTKTGFVAGDTVLVAAGTYTGTGDQAVLLDESVRLLGGWNVSFTSQIGTSILDGQGARRGLTVNSGVVATMERFAIQNGWAPYYSVPGDQFGGGVFNDGALTLRSTTVSTNTAGPGIVYSGAGGGIFNQGILTLTNSLVRSNSAAGGGGILNSASGGIGIVTLNNSAIQSNVANGGGGGGIAASGVVILNNSTVRDNTAHVSGGGGGGIATSGELVLTNSTVSGNTVTSTVQGGAAVRGGGIYSHGWVVLNNSTITGNSVHKGAGSGGTGGGIQTAGTLFAQNTIIAGNSASVAGPDCSGTISSAGYNLIGNTSGCTFTAAAGDLINLDARLFVLVGMPGSHPLKPGSPAIDAGNPNGCKDHMGNPLNTDQRGMTRVGRCDIGAYEYHGEIQQVFLPAVTRNYCSSRFFDDFSDPASGWPLADNGIIRLEYLNSEYRILVRPTGWWAGGRPGIAVSNSYLIDVDVRNASGVYGSYGILFGLADNWSQFYTFEIDRDGYWVIWRFNDSSGWTLLAIGSSGSIATGTATNHLRLERFGTSIAVYANGQQLTAITDGAYTGIRRVGLIATAYSQPNVDARFDNFDVCGVASGLSATSQDLSDEAMRMQARHERRIEAPIDAERQLSVEPR